MTGDSRMTWGLVIDVLGVLDRHGYQRADNTHTGRAIGLLFDLARVYEGSREAPASACPVPVPAPPQAGPAPGNRASDSTVIGTAQVRTVVAALDVAAEHKRDIAADCADCADRSCGFCQAMTAAAGEYDAVRNRLRADAEPAPARMPAAGHQLRAVPEPEAGQ